MLNCFECYKWLYRFMSKWTYLSESRFDIMWSKINVLIMRRSSYDVNNIRNKRVNTNSVVTCVVRYLTLTLICFYFLIFIVNFSCTFQKNIWSFSYGNNYLPSWYSITKLSLLWGRRKYLKMLYYNERNVPGLNPSPFT